MNLSSIPEIIKHFVEIQFTNKFPPNVIKIAEKYPHLEMINIIYKSDNLKIHGYILKKKDIAIKTPVIIYCRNRNNHPEHSIGDIKPGSLFNQDALFELVNKGKIILFATNYRGSQLSEGVDE